MKNILKLSLIAVILSFAVSCSEDDTVINVNDEGVGEERFIVSSVSQVTADETTGGIVSGRLGEPNLLQLQGYVMPNFISSVTVSATISSNQNVSFIYNEENISNGESFQVEEWFTESSFANVVYVPLEAGNITINMTFTNTLGSVVSLSQTIAVE